MVVVMVVMQYRFAMSTLRVELVINFFSDEFW